jgi:hypothetical protein
MKTEFKEVQKFTQWWLWLILIGIGALSFWAIYKQIMIGEPMGSNPFHEGMLYGAALPTLCVLLLFALMRLQTEIDQDGIRMKYFPFVRKKVSWKDIENATVLNYGFVGGLGIRIATKYGTVFNTKGKIGLAIELKNGKKFLIGTQKEAELNAILEKAKAQGWM